MAFQMNSLARLRLLTCVRPTSTLTPNRTLTLTLTRSITTTTATPQPATPTSITLDTTTLAQTQAQTTSPTILALLERTTLYPERSETTYSGTDNAVGDNLISYDPRTTTPETEFALFEEQVHLGGEKAGEVDALFISPANRDFSRLIERELDGRCVDGHKGDRMGLEGSVRGWVKKGRVVKVKNVGEFERLLRGLRRVQMREGLGKGQSTKI